MASSLLAKSTLILTLLLFFSVKSSAQFSKGIEIDASSAYVSKENFTYAISVSGMLHLNKQLDVSAGLMFLHSKVERRWSDNLGTYSIDDKINKLNGLISSTIVQPIYKGWGLFGKATFTFEPIPVSLISLDKRNSNEPSSSSSDKYVFTQFNPGGMIDAGIYKEIKKDGSAGRIYLGVGYGYYDLYKRYRGVTLYNQNLSDHIPTDKSLYRISIRVSGWR